MKRDEELANIGLFSEILVRIAAVEKILIDKKILTPEELAIELDNVSMILAKNMLKVSNIPGDHDKILQDLKNDLKPKIVV